MTMKKRIALPLLLLVSIAGFCAAVTFQPLISVIMLNTGAPVAQTYVQGVNKYNRTASYKYINDYVTTLCARTDMNIEQMDAILFSSSYTTRKRMTDSRCAIRYSFPKAKSENTAQSFVTVYIDHDAKIIGCQQGIPADQDWITTGPIDTTVTDCPIKTEETKNPGD